MAWNIFLRFSHFKNTSQMPSASYYISDCCIGLVAPCQSATPPIYKYLDGSCPARAGGWVLPAAALCCRGRFCIRVAHHFLSLVNGGRGMWGFVTCPVRSPVTAPRLNPQSRSWQVGEAHTVQGHGSEESRSGGRSADIGKKEH